MHIIIGILVHDDHDDQHTDRHTKRQSKNINQGKSFVSKDIPESGEEVVFNHGEQVGALMNKQGFIDRRHHIP
jgi:hypothetical protein